MNALNEVALTAMLCYECNGHYVKGTGLAYVLSRIENNQSLPTESNLYLFRNSVVELLCYCHTSEIQTTGCRYIVSTLGTMQQ